MLVDILTTRALVGRVGGEGGEGGDNCVKTNLNQSTSPCLRSTAPTRQDHGVSLAFLGGKPMWIQRAAILSRIFDRTPEIFDDGASTLASLGATVQVRLTKQAFEN